MADKNLSTRTLPAAVQSEDYGKLIKPFAPAADTTRPKRKPRGKIQKAAVSKRPFISLSARPSRPPPFCGFAKY